MDPISLIVTALAAGAAAGLKPTAEQVIKDAYASIKSFIRNRYSRVSLSELETKPESEKKRESLVESLQDAGASQDSELLSKARELLETLQQHAPAAGAAIGVDLEDVKSKFLKAQKIIATGTGVKVRQSDFSEGIDLGEVWAGSEGAPHPK